MKVVSIPAEKLMTSFHSEVKRSFKVVKNPNRKIALPTMEGLTFERIKDILYLEAKGNYTSIHFMDGHKQLVCRTLRDIEELLINELGFIRIHRSHTINLDYLQKYVKGKGGYVILEGGQSISVSTGRKQAFMNAVGTYFS